MQNIKLISAYSLQDPTKEFVVCDLDEGREFLDPLILFSQKFHDPYKVNEEGLYAIGGDITAETMMTAYKWGIFPWYAYKMYEQVYWYCPERRFVIYPEKIHISHSMRTLLNKNKYHITINQAFDSVIHNCRYVNKRDEHECAWLNDSI